MDNFYLPKKFLERLTDIVGQSLFWQIEKTFAERPTTFRVNALKTQKHENTENTKSLLEDKGFKLKHVQWYKDAFILLNKTKRELTDTQLYKEGKIYIQSLASMVPPLVLFEPEAGLPAEAPRAKAGEKVLDVTAAPGSKTSQIAALMEGQGELIANDNNKVRFFKLKHNMELLGVTNDRPPRHALGVSAPPSKGGDSAVVHARQQQLSTPYEGGAHSPTGLVGWSFTLRMEDGSHLCGEYQNYFDKILVDAPCSAEARFIADEPKTYGYWSEKKIKEMAYKQRKLLFSAWYALKPGGTLVYSTCTFAPEENELQVSKLLERYPNEIEMLPIELAGLKILRPLKAWKEKIFHSDVQKAVRILPSAEIEGFFIAKMKKKD